MQCYIEYFNTPCLHFLFGQRLDHFLSEIIDRFHLSRLHRNFSNFCSLESNISHNLVLHGYVNIKTYFLRGKKPAP